MTVLLIQLRRLSKNDFLIHQGYMICYQESFLMFKIRVLSLPEIIDTDKKKTHIIVKTIHSSLHSKQYIFMCFFNFNKQTSITL